jgi:hypothetical protein
MTLDLLPNEDTRNLSYCGLPVGMEARLHNDTYQCVNIISGVRALGSLSLRSYRGARGPFSETNCMPCVNAEALKSHIEMQYIAPIYGLSRPRRRHVKY